MLARFLRRSKVDNYENHRSNPYKETACGVGVCIALRPQTIYAETLPIYFIESGRPLVKVNSRGTFLFSPDRQPVGEQVPQVRHGWTSEQTGPGSEAYHGHIRYRKGHRGYTERQAERDESQREMAGSHRQGGVQKHVQKFFISLGARFGRIRKCPKGKPSPQLYQYKLEKLQELVHQYEHNLIDLYFGDESHMCTEGYVPYGWTFPWEEVSIPSQKEKRLNIFGMVSYESDYKGFSTTESITTEKVADFLDKFSMTIKKETFIVLDNAKVHRSKLMMEMRRIWEKRGLYLFFLPPYSPHLNIAETLWRILKGKWIQPADYSSADSLFYAVDRSLAALGTTSFIRFSRCA